MRVHMCTCLAFLVCVLVCCITPHVCVPCPHVCICVGVTDGEPLAASVFLTRLI